MYSESIPGDSFHCRIGLDLQAVLQDQKERWGSGSPLRVEDYLKQNPQWESDQEAVFAIGVKMA